MPGMRPHLAHRKRPPMTIGLRSWYPTASKPGDFRLDPRPLDRPPEPPRYCTCGTKLRRTNRDPLCSPCDEKRRRWLHNRGLL
jgi:hypothetical protein